MDKNHEQDLKINKLSIMAEQNERDHKQMSDKIDIGFDKMDLGIMEMKKEFLSFKNEADRKYASKRIEKVVDNLTYIVMTTVVLAILGLIFI